MIKWDGHTHTRFCKHGSSAEQELYIKEAVKHGFQRYSITEHPPLPEEWIKNEALMAELAMSMEELPAYFDYVRAMKAKYTGIIDIATGLEVDYLYGAEDFSEAMLNPWLHTLEDIVVSVHYLPGAGGMRCIDYTADDFKEGLLDDYGSMDAVVNEYYDHVEKAIAWAAGLPGRVRIGHINLIEKFRTALPEQDQSLIQSRLECIVPLLSAAGVGVDVNTAGLRVATCGKAYVPEWFLRKCQTAGIACVYGSDSHRPEHVGFGWEWFAEAVAGEGK
jgi:histidinol-phosphatase (PHP family)